MFFLMFYKFILAFSISLILLLIYMMVSNTSPISNSYEKKTPFECGFDPISCMRNSMSTRFFVLVMLFLIFDIEISLLFPFFNLIILKNSILMMISVIGFIILLFLSLMIEWSQEVLDWV
uniref:NADH-ubiquinone oxidoreductase chain 3 n=1 Tax=Succineidae gen. n. sp. z RM-2021 TaxID=2871687 RepID=A0A977XTX0_9EUPU|nr:NADH dehydrogenase subunit 3 [Succineidae gen. n. sp. z RM-2021]